MARVRSLEELEQDLYKMVALHNHEHAYKGQVTYNLPYRVLLDYYKRRIDGEKDENEVPINIYYPLPKVPEVGRWDPEQDGGYTEKQWFLVCLYHTGEFTADGKEKCELWKIPPTIQAKIDEKGKPFRRWDLETEQGRQHWLYFFMTFIMPYKDDIPHFSVFDMFGDTKHTEQELNERIAYYMELIEKCERDPELYKHDIAVIGEYE